MRRSVNMRLDQGSFWDGTTIAASGCSLPGTPYYYHLTWKNTSFHLFFSSFRSIVVTISIVSIFISSCPLSISRIVVAPFRWVLSILLCCLPEEGFVNESGHLKNLYLDRDIHQQILSASSALSQSPRLDNRTTGRYMGLCENIWLQLPYCAPYHESLTKSQPLFGNKLPEKKVIVVHTMQTRDDSFPLEDLLWPRHRIAASMLDLANF